ncbi:MAG: hypothetical protein EKK63_13725 [Acinetobacter sp.]|uniref:hypothetical protein n=1 Tax=Acinetobacter sp. TaxID=472 RepID=UPI000FBC34FE|nr:hypothetical protein [Acinetobacter sp.]RUP37961.1 MAG: hypothetical protein EKK63_13725 [Acinetobacter sp.]
MSWSIKASITCVPIHDNMVLSITDVPEGARLNVKKLRRIFKDMDFETVKDMISQSGFADRLSVQQVQQGG